VEEAHRIRVIATTAEGTRSALEAAKRLPGAARADIIVLVPHVITAAAAIEQTGGSETCRIKASYRELLRSVGVDAAINVCVCRRDSDVFRWMLGQPSLVIVGGRRRWWWPTAAQRMVGILERAGQTVLFAQVARQVPSSEVG
jgi:hypothetical protein